MFRRTNRNNKNQPDDSCIREESRGDDLSDLNSFIGNQALIANMAEFLEAEEDLLSDHVPEPRSASDLIPERGPHSYNTARIDDISDDDSFKTLEWFSRLPFISTEKQETNAG